MNRTRGYRRYKASLKKQKCKRYWNAGYYAIDNNPQTDKQILGIVANTPKSCSCWMCGNQRKHFGESIQEVKQKAHFNEKEE